MRLTIYTSESILKCLLTDMKPTGNEPKYPVWVNFINTAIADIKYRPAPYVILDEKKEDSIEALISRSTQVSANLSIKKMTNTEIALICQIEDTQLEYVNALNLDTSILSARSIIILDIEPDIAENISNLYGVICHSFSVPPEDSPLFYEGREIYFKKDSYEKFFYNNRIQSGRTHLLTKYPINPINSLILLDRYLLSFDKSNQTTPDDGKKNIVAFIENILPPQLNEDFHLLLLCEVIPLSNQYGYLDEAIFKDEIISFNNYLKDRIKRPYNIEIEIISLTYFNSKYNNVKPISNHCLTHNRRILSNFFVIRAEHSLKMQSGAKMLYAQYVSLDWALSKGIIRYLDSDLPEVCISDCIQTVKTLIRKNPHILFSQNGELKPISEIVNRLLK